MTTRTSTAGAPTWDTPEAPAEPEVRPERTSHSALRSLLQARPADVVAERDAIDRVKAWTKSGHVADAAAGRDSAWLRERAKDGTLGLLPPLTSDDERLLSPEELRVYVEARAWQNYFATQPKTLEQGQDSYIREKLRSLPEIISGLRETIDSGRLGEELRTAWCARIATFEQELACVASGNLRFESASPELEIASGELRLLRDASGLVIGTCVGPAQVNWHKLCAAYGDHGSRIAYASSEYFGGYVVTW